MSARDFQYDLKLRGASSTTLRKRPWSGLWRDPADELACMLARRPAGQHDALARQEAHPPMASLTLASSRRFPWATYLLD
jgi:hypothetical protein